MHNRRNNVRSTCLGETVSKTPNTLVNHYMKLSKQAEDEATKHTYQQHAEHYRK